MYSEPNDEEAQFANSGQQFLFSEKSIRLGFIRKVYSILLCQLMVTCAFMTIFLYVDEVKEYSRKNIWLWVVAFVLTFITLIAMACCENVRRQFPMNLIFLSIFTLCESYLLGAVASCYDAEAVLIAAGITAVVALALTIFAFQTKWDFTMMGGLLFVFLIILIVFGILAAIMHNKILEIVYASIGALIFSAYLVFDTQLMLGGKHKYALSPEEYIFAALNLYLDVINLFLFILRIVGAARN
ncbi:hypothetical protein ACJMK2_021872 [Sinanodonta woodiana]|uniref:Protein lifeguard 1 n=1 Tax=Sinanodonta woodiana TaxID=1069815 RepID=A0ABD3TH31_SINWO